ncbi:hypothetical protein JL721_5477 [Aureococcus anophagefferens]|nr:hypothetical protein JL721_5477 [Aureococcus anophagefferens]
MSDFDDAAPETWTVVHGPRVAVRGAPSTDAPCVGLRKRGDVLEPIAVVDGWLQLAAGQYVLIDGAPLGFGPLVAGRRGAHAAGLEPARRDALLRRRVRADDDDPREPAPRGRREPAAVAGRERRGLFPFRDGDTVAACGLRDGDVVGVRYDGDAGFDLGLRRAPGRRVMYRHDADGFPIYDDAATPRFWIDNGSLAASSAFRAGKRGAVQPC